MEKNKKNIGVFKEKPRRRSLEELNLIDDFLFQEIISRGEAGEEICRILLSTILGRPIGRVHVTTQKVIAGFDTTQRGIRMDAYAESETEDAMNVTSELYDIEPDTTYEKAILPWRTRLYQALIDAKQLEAGWDCGMLKNVYIIMILPYDPFNENRMVYTIKNQCIEEPELEYEDGIRRIYLYTKGTEGNPSQALRDMLKYMENSIAENVTNADIQAIHEQVDAVKQDREVGVQYMKSWEREMLIRAEGREEGRAEGREEGRAEGREEGMQRLNTLIIRLTEDGRTDDIVKAAKDEAYQRALLEEYGLIGK